ncbi:uncharacterized protein LOC124131247 [Haliotis rufescens]|uniref:uncharacterized protein LOC124131247 n=1 Tax=Haliotis rufescens TaxID=6454 RepID=UPI00201F5926|nr:uncharacterized protein LOC124131247 [Haliotis rufescens]
MMTSSLNMLRIVVVLSLVVMATGEFTFTCNRSPSAIGPAMPELPQQYEMRVEANIIQSQKTIEVLESYDFPGKVVALTMITNGQISKSIHNFKTQERYDILANETCNTTSINSDSDNYNIFGFTAQGTDGKIQMASVSDVFKFAKKYNVSYVRETMIRGIPVNQWTSCQVSAELHASFKLDYYFSRRGYESATGSENIPIRFVISGQADNGETSGIHNFSHVYEFSVFKPGPIKDRSVFETPRGVVCTGRNNSVPLPKLVDQFTAEVEIDAGRQQPPHNMKVYFDYNFKLIRNDRFYSKDERHQYGAGLITKIEDYKTGLEYVIDRAEGNCTVHKIPEKTWRSVAKDSHNITMLHAQELLKIQSRNLVYQGERVLRGMPVDVWASVTPNNMVQEIYFLKQASVSGKPTPPSVILGMYFKNITAYNLGKPMSQGQPQPGQGQTTPGQGQPQPGQGQPRPGQGQPQPGQGQPQPGQGQPTPGQGQPSPSPPQGGPGSGNSIGLQRNPPEKFVSVFNFHVGHPDVDVFDIRPCYQETAQRSLYMTFKISGSYSQDVYGHKSIFFPPLRTKMALSANVSLIRIADIKVRQDDDSDKKLIVSFTLLDKAPIKGSVADPPKETSLEHAHHLIMLSAANGIAFAVPYPIHSKIFTVHTYSMTSNASPPVTTAVESGLSYSPGSMAGLGIGMIIFGTIIGLLIAFIVYRRIYTEVPYERN